MIPEGQTSQNRPVPVNSTRYNFPGTQGDHELLLSQVIATGLYCSPVLPWIFVFGLAFGSFMNVCIYRLPRGISVIHPRSACPNCKSPISFFDNIPVFSWFILGGKCRNCKQPIAARYWIIEMLMGAHFALSASIG